MTGSRIALPATETDVSVEWLNLVLDDSPKWTQGPIASAELEPIGGIDSLASAVFRARIALESGLETSLLVKMQLPEQAPRLLAMYEAEAYFYNRYAERVGIPVPRTYFSAFDRDLKRLVVVQDFLTDGVVGTSGEFLTPADLSRAVINLADLHAKWWRSRELLEDSRVRRMQDLVARSNAVLQDPERNPVPGFIQRYGDQLSPQMARFMETMPLWRPILAGKPWPPDTLIHADCSSKNTMFPDDSARAPILLDWAFFHSGPGAYDLAVLISESASPASQAEVPRLLDAYLDRLRSGGVEDYQIAGLREDYVHMFMFRSYGLPLVASWGTAESLAYLDTVIKSASSVLSNSGAFDVAAELAG